MDGYAHVFSFSKADSVNESNANDTKPSAHPTSAKTFILWGLSDQIGLVDDAKDIFNAIVDGKFQPGHKILNRTEEEAMWTRPNSHGLFRHTIGAAVRNYESSVVPLIAHRKSKKRMFTFKKSCFLHFYATDNKITANGFAAFADGTISADDKSELFRENYLLQNAASTWTNQDRI